MEVPTNSTNRMSDPAIIDVDIDVPTFRARRVVIGVVVGTCLVLAGIFLAVVHWSLGIAFLLAVTAAVIARLHVRRVQREKELLALLQGGHELGPAAVAKASLKIVPPDEFTLRRLARVLRANGFEGRVVRAGQGLDPPPGAPLEMPFEPQLLDEDQVELVALEGGEPGERSPAPPARKGRFAFTWPSLRRTMLLSGVWIYLIIGIQWIRSVAEAIRTKRVTVWICVFSALLFLMLAMPMASGQHLAVPGGLVCRAGSWRRAAPDVHLFSRPSSLLCLVSLSRRAPRRWLVSAADGVRTTLFLATTRETRFLLRAWLSPLPTPTLEQLSDLR